MATDSDGQGTTDSGSMIEEDREFWHIQFDLWQRIVIWIVIPFVILQTSKPNFVWIWVIWSVLAVVMNGTHIGYDTLRRKYR